MRDAIHVTWGLRELGWRVEVTADGPKLVPAVRGAILPPGVKKQLALLKPEVVKLHTAHVCEAEIDAAVPLTGKHAGTGYEITVRPCGATVFDGMALAEANNTGVGCGCPYSHCSYRG